MDDCAARFRAELEARTGERVLAVTAASEASGKPGSNPTWGILALTDASLRFIRQKDQNWVSAFFGSRAETPQAVEPAELVFPLDSGFSFQTPPRGLAQRLFGSPFGRLDVTHGEGLSHTTASFSIEPRCRLLDELDGLLRRRAAERPCPTDASTGRET